MGASQSPFARPRARHRHHNRHRHRSHDGLWGVLGLVLLLVGVAGGARAQIVNVLPVLADEQADGFHGEVSASGSLTRGNINFFSGRAGGLLRYHQGQHVLLSSSAIQLGIAGDNVFLDRRITHVRYQFSFIEQLGLETLGQLTYDTVWRLRLRAIAGVGGFSNLLRTDTATLILGLTYLLEGEEYSKGPFVDAGARRLNHRASSYLMGKLALDPRVAVVQNLFFQPRIDDPSDFRVFSQTELRVKLFYGLALAAVQTLTWDNSPAETIESLDSNTMLNLVAPL